MDENILEDAMKERAKQAEDKLCKLCHEMEEVLEEFAKATYDDNIVFEHLSMERRFHVKSHILNLSADMSDLGESIMLHRLAKEAKQNAEPERETPEENKDMVQESRRRPRSARHSSRGQSPSKSE